LIGHRNIEVEAYHIDQNVGIRSERETQYTSTFEQVV